MAQTIYVVLAPAIDYNDEVYSQAGTEEDGWSFVGACTTPEAAFQLAEAADWVTSDGVPDWADADGDTRLNPDGSCTFLAIVLEVVLNDGSGEPTPKHKPVKRP